jgi:hypothetical protein
MSAPASKFKVADLSLAAFGRKEIELAEVCYLDHQLFSGVNDRN